MGDWDDDVRRAFEEWARETGAPKRVVRRCAHHAEGREGTLYPAELYVRALQRLRGGLAAALASRVEPFFWADAQKTDVWLCEECARTAGLGQH